MTTTERVQMITTHSTVSHPGSASAARAEHCRAAPASEPRLTISVRDRRMCTLLT
ncbi:hypothetical protein [Sphaerisporangium corydalis]